MTLNEELISGPLANEIAPHIASGNDNAILEILNRKDIPVCSTITVGAFADWLASTGLRSVVEDHAHNTNSQLRSIALSILDLLIGNHDYQLDFGSQSKREMLMAWVTNGDITIQQHDELLSKSIKNISRAEQLKINVTHLDVAKALRG